MGRVADWSVAVGVELGIRPSLFAHECGSDFGLALLFQFFFLGCLHLHANLLLHHLPAGHVNRSSFVFGLWTKSHRDEIILEHLAQKWFLLAATKIVHLSYILFL